jgi:sucrose-phosphate synthase
MDFSNVVAEDIDGDGDKDDISFDGASPRSLPPIWAEVGV